MSKTGYRLEQNANKVIMLWNIAKPSDDTAIVGAYVAQNRRGRTGTIVFKFDGAHMRFQETDEEYTPPAKKQKKGLFS